MNPFAHSMRPRRPAALPARRAAGVGCVRERAYRAAFSGLGDKPPPWAVEHTGPDGLTYYRAKDDQIAGTVGLALTAYNAAGEPKALGSSLAYVGLFASSGQFGDLIDVMDAADVPTDAALAIVGDPLAQDTVVGVLMGYSLDELEALAADLEPAGPAVVLLEPADGWRASSPPKPEDTDIGRGIKLGSWLGGGLAIAALVYYDRRRG